MKKKLTQKKLTLDKLQVSKLDNLSQVKGGSVSKSFSGCVTEGIDYTDIWRTITSIF